MLIHPSIHQLVIELSVPIEEQKTKLNRPILVELIFWE
jgi:hypothetical protein